MLELPHTAGCIVCGHDNPHGLHLRFHVNPETAEVRCRFVPSEHHMGFHGIVHGGLLATVLDEAMVWAATWAGRRFCVSGEMTIRYRQSANIGQPLDVVARVEELRPRLIRVEGSIADATGGTIVLGSGIYVPLPPEKSRQFVGTLQDEPHTRAAMQMLMQE